MAYISHNPYRAFENLHRRGGAVVAGAPMLAKCAIVAAIASAVILGLSGAASKPTGAAIAAAAKSDRLALADVSSAPRIAGAFEAVSARSGGVEVRRDSGGRVVYINDPAARTTTVARGATAPLSPDSPLGPNSR